MAVLPDLKEFFYFQPTIFPMDKVYKRPVNVIRSLPLLITMTSTFLLSQACKSRNGFDRINQQLRNSDSAQQVEAIKSLDKFKPSLKDQIRMLEEAAKPYPGRGYMGKSVGAWVIASATRNPDPRLTGVIAKNFQQYDLPGKQEALGYLSSVNDRENIEAFADLFTKHAAEILVFPAGILEQNYSYRDIIFPKLLTVSPESPAYSGVLLLLLKYLQAGRISAEALHQQYPLIIQYSRQLRSKLDARGTGNKWDDPELFELTDNAGIVADLLGSFHDRAAIEELQKFLLQHDNRLKMFAAVSLLKQDQPVSDAAAFTIAADPEARNLFYESLAALKKESFFPAKYATQASFAESDMINWLTYPTELGRLPDSIELMETPEFDLPGGGDKAVFFLFRFKSDHEGFKDYGWMAGVSGYYLKSEMPTTSSNGYTFSSFEKWDAKTPDRHIEELRETISDFNKKQ